MSVLSACGVIALAASALIPVAVAAAAAAALGQSKSTCSSFCTQCQLHFVQIHSSRNSVLLLPEPLGIQVVNRESESGQSAQKDG